MRCCRQRRSHPPGNEGRHQWQGREFGPDRPIPRDNGISGYREAFDEGLGMPGQGFSSIGAGITRSGADTALILAESGLGSIQRILTGG